MTDIEPVLKRLGLQQYIDVFVAEGFDTWATLLDIQESDLEQLNVKLGHRRKLQRAIAEWRGWSSDRPLGSPSQEGSVSDFQRPEGAVPETGSSKDLPVSATAEQKRKYRRHPKPDENAPEKPPSAYVLFSNRVREEVKSENLSFTDIARLVGERWQKLDPAQKDLFESHASTLKDTYNSQLAEYKKTDAYKEYTQYLADFKAKHANPNEQKRPKLELKDSSSQSATSQGDLAEAILHLPGHSRGASIGSASTVSYSGQAATALPSLPPFVSAMAHLNAPVVRRSSPPYHAAQERRPPGHLSSQSSVSEESSSARTDHGDTLSRTATLSLATPSSGTTPPPTLGHAVSRIDYPHVPGYSPLSSRWPFQPSPSSAVGSVSGNTATPPLSSVMGGNQEKGRPLQAGSPPQPAPQPGSLPISQLVAASHAQEQSNLPSRRALPPPRQLTGTTNQTPFTTFGVATHQAHFPQPSSEIVPIRRGNTREVPSRSENEAADTLAGLSERQQGTYPPWTSYSRPEEHR